MSELQSEPNSNGQKLDGRKATQFKPGQVGNPAGRPKGSRNRLQEAFVAEMCAAFEEDGGAAIRKVRDQDPGTFMKVIAQILPKQIEVGEAGAFSDFDDAKVDEFIAIATRKLLPDRSATVN